ncbi:MAG: hypothetical protein LW878_13225 [Proteobacteria bacterium]|jgi:hypothetical protein|nr:hypothetical protein [Pseudomonadota bacterium]
MSFGIKSFKKNKQDLAAGEKRHITHVILGQDISAVLKLVSLKSQHAPENLRLITPRFLTREVLIDQFRCSPSTLRSNEHTLQVLEKYPFAKSLRYETESLFYKDGSWHKFNSRAKPMELKSFEETFRPARQELTLESLFSPEDWEQLDETLKTYQSVRVLEKLEKQVPTDLAQVDEWWMLFHDLGEVTATHLYTSLSARELLKRSGQGQSLPTEMSAWLSSVEKKAAIAIRFDCSKQLHEETQTLFIPQSMTHEWGHFIVDVHPYDAQTKSHPLMALILLHDEEPTSEIMADKIKLLKRVFERVFPRFQETIQSEYIFVSEDFFEVINNEKLAEELNVGVPSLTLLGQYSTENLTHNFLSRALLSVSAS